MAQLSHWQLYQLKLNLSGYKMSIKQYLLDHKLTQQEFATMCGMSKRAIENAIKQDYQIFGNTVYSPRFQINEGVDNE